MKSILMYKEIKMRKGMFGCLVVLCCGLLLSAGCAKEEVVKKDEPVTQTPVAPPQPTVQPKKIEEPVAQPVKEAPAVAAKEETGGEGSKASATNGAFDKIYFGFDKSDLSKESRDALSRNADTIKKGSDKIQIEGHCDERGSDEYNLALGERRAKAAYKYLITLGVPADRLSTISYGKERPADPGHDEAAWAKNRRDEFVIAK
jgi:peptidoglycan-associated lipoprotein